MRNPLTSDHLLSMVSAPIIWMVHLVVSYAIVSLACAFDYADARLLGFDAVVFSIGLVTVTAFTLIAYTAAINYEKWRERVASGAQADIGSFIALNAVLLCALSAIALVWVAFPSFVLAPCAS